MRRGLRILLGLFAAGALAVALLPWWLGLALHPLGRTQGVTFERYERVGYGRFRLHAVRREDPGVVATAASVEVDTPLLWAWRAGRGADTAISVHDWRLDLSGPPPPQAEDAVAPASMAALHASVNRMLGALTRWVPQAALGRGEIHSAGLAPVTIAEIDWQRGALTARGLRVAGRDLELAAQSGVGGAIEVRLRVPADAARLELSWAGAEVHGDASWHGQPLRFAAFFSEHGWIPVDAEIIAERWSVPASRAGMEVQYAQLTGGGKLVWHAEKFELTAEAHAAPNEGSDSPPMQARLAAHGDRSALTLTAFDVDAPFAEAKLSAPVTFGFAGPLQAPPAQLSLRVDLAKQTWFDASGVVEGSVEVTSTAGGSSERFQLTCAQARLFGYDLQQATAQGVLHWPILKLEKLEVALDAESHFTASGALDLAQRTLAEVAFTGTFTPAWFQRWLPAGASWGTAEVAATLSGPLTAPLHEGSATLTQVRHPPLQSLDATIEWRGSGATLDDATATLAAGASSLRIAGAVADGEAQVREFQLQQDGTDVLALVAPATIAWAPEWRIAALRLEGPGGQVELTAESVAGELSFEVGATNFESSWARDWIATTGPAWTVKTVQAAGRTEQGSLGFTLELDAQVALEPRPARVALAARGDAAGVEITWLEARDETGVLAQAHGRVPVSWSARRTPRLQLDPEGTLQFEAETEPESALWAAIAAPLGITMAQPRARLQLSGTAATPSGQLELDVQRLAMADPARKEWVPAWDNLRVRAHADRGTIVVESVSAAVEGQVLQASAQWPMDAERWARLLRTPASFDWSEVEGQVEIPGADLRALAEGRPQFPLARGRLQVSAQLARGLQLSGSLKLTEAATRPVPSVGVLQPLSVELELKGRVVEVRSFSAQLGGETVALSGSADLATPAAPKLDLKLAGKNLPLVRKAGLLLRSDLDLALATDTEGQTRITGTVNVHDSLVLAELKQLLPTGVRAAERAPPYFAVEAEPFRHWRLDIAVRGPRGLRLHTAVLTGFASPRFQLEGTLGEPRAVGEVALDSGKILFPFAAFQVQLAVVRLTRADPFHPRLNFNATARRYGYDLRLEGRGTADQPIITLSSNPALTAEQVLLLVMAGQAPSDAAGTAAGNTDRNRLTVLGAYLGRGLFRDLGGDDPDRLTITSGEQVTQQGGETYLVEYLLGRRWSLVGEYDEFDDYNVGLKWRIYSEGGTDEPK